MEIHPKILPLAARTATGATLSGQEAGAELMGQTFLMEEALLWAATRAVALAVVHTQTVKAVWAALEATVVSGVALVLLMAV